MKNLFTVVIAGSQYLLHPQKLGTIEQTINPDALIPVTLLTTSEINGDVDGILDLFAAVDDVFQSDFGGILVEKPEKDSTIGFVQNIGPRSSRTVVSLKQIEAEDGAEADTPGFGDLPSGPYFLHGPNLYQAWRLYDDVLDAFTVAVIPNSINDTDDGYEALSSLSDNGLFKSIAVPSRLYHAAPSIRKPLSGVRISITDAASLKGVRTTLSSRAWTELHDAEATETAQFIESLIDMGAIIVGKTKSSQFDSGREWVDVKAPWNPRGDGYQDSGGSAAGAGASVSGYDWMEYAIAQDGFDGVREQARVHGVYSIRSSAGAIPLGGWQIDSQSYAAAGFSSRSLKDLLKFVQAASNFTDDKVAFPKRILYPSDVVSISDGNQALRDKFVATLERLLGIQADKVSISEIWDSKPPSEADGQSLEEYMRQAPFSSFCADFHHQYEDFRRSYKEKFGRAPYVEATPRFRWDVGENESAEDEKSHRERIEVFKTWFAENVMPTLQSSDSIMILPFGSHHTVHYRDDLPQTPNRINGIGSGTLAPLLGLPHLIVPFAQTTYHSRVTDRAESRPFSGSIMGPAGSDIMLIQLVKAAFEHAKWRSQVDAGRLAFPEDSNAE
ncbi:amidase signature enzyme [Trichoderma evansii]